MQVGLPAALAGAATLTGPTPQQGRGRWRKAKPAKKKMKSTGQAWHVSGLVFELTLSSTTAVLQNRYTQVLHGRLPFCSQMLHGNEMLQSKPLLSSHWPTTTGCHAFV